MINCPPDWDFSGELAGCVGDVFSTNVRLLWWHHCYWVREHSDHLEDPNWGGYCDVKLEGVRLLACNLVFCVGRFAHGKNMDNMNFMFLKQYWDGNQSFKKCKNSLARSSQSYVWFGWVLGSVCVSSLADRCTFEKRSCEVFYYLLHLLLIPLSWTCFYLPWGTISASNTCFAAILHNGHVVTWGENHEAWVWEWKKSMCLVSFCDFVLMQTQTCSYSLVGWQHFVTEEFPQTFLLRKQKRQQGFQNRQTYI